MKVPLPPSLTLGAAVLWQLFHYGLITPAEAEAWVHERLDDVAGYPDWLDGLVSAKNPEQWLAALRRVPGFQAHGFEEIGPFLVTALLAAQDEPLTPLRAFVLVTDPYLLCHSGFARRTRHLGPLHALAEQHLPEPAQPPPSAEEVAGIADELRTALERVPHAR